ncbi:nucleotidyltransferase domain-containing protein [Candidatus Gottesmanbacteria bacterium]|nr:nucleotidyltransferase domain-containing protein [Candidatus Gottesmanbacteria bacterium]
MATRKTVNSKIKEKVLEFSRLLKRENIQTDQIILYGSWAKGTARDYSDIDLCVISPLFANRPDDYFKKIWHLASKIDSSLEPIPFTPEELNNRYSSLAQEIKKYGIRVT